MAENDDFYFNIRVAGVDQVEMIKKYVKKLKNSEEMDGSYLFRKGTYLFVELILLSLVYNCYTCQGYMNHIWCVHASHARMFIQIIMHTFSVYMSALHKSFYAINLLCIPMHVHM